MKYKIYCNGSVCKVPGFIWDMASPQAGSSCPVSSGGDLLLSNGDVLHINKQYGEIDNEYEAGSLGIELTLESGHNFISYLISPDNDHSQESGYGVFYDLGWEYEEGNILKIYDLSTMAYEDLGEEYDEDSVAQYPGVTLIGVIIILDGNWEITYDTRYLGNSVELNSGEQIFISGPVMNDAVGVYFTRSSGNGCFAYYKRNGTTLKHTSNYWFGSPVCAPQEDDTITIYDFGSDDYQEAIDFTENYTEENVSEYLSVLCVLRFDGDSWCADEDYSNDRRKDN